jgi:hypothetical protein
MMAVDEPMHLCPVFIEFNMIVRKAAPKLPSIPVNCVMLPFRSEPKY